MSAAQTEKLHPKSPGLDLAEDREVLGILLAAQVEAVQSVSQSIPDLAKGAGAMAKAIQSGGTLVYAAAGSSGLMGLADGLEIPPTFGVPNAQIRILRAGGLEDMSVPKGSAEDDEEAARNDAEGITERDCVICLAASGNTPYAVAIMEYAKSVGAVTIGISNNTGARLLEADIPIHLSTPPEVIAGSTRLGAGSAQKIALNMMSTLMGIRLGHVLDGRMVNMVANNHKLRGRAENMVMEITGCARAVASAKLDLAGGGVKEAALLARGARDLIHARELLTASEQNLRTALLKIDAG